MELYDILKIQSLSEKTYKDISLALLTAYSLYWMEEWMLPTTIEAVSILNFKLFPLKFSMVGFPEFPDALRANRSLLQLGPKYRNLLTGAAKKGYFLNSRGRAEAEGLIKLLGIPKLADKEIDVPLLKEKSVPKEGIDQPRTIHPENVVKEVRKSTLFKRFKENDFETPPLIHLLGLLKLYENAPAKEKKSRLHKIEIASKQIDDKEVSEFIKLVKEKFSDYIQRD